MFPSSLQLHKSKDRSLIYRAPIFIDKTKQSLKIKNIFTFSPFISFNLKTNKREEKYFSIFSIQLTSFVYEKNVKICL